MTQEECLASPHHFTHLGVCYPGSVAWIGISSPDNPQPATFKVAGQVGVPEPGTLALMILGLVALRMMLVIISRARSNPTPNLGVGTNRVVLRCDGMANCGR